ncbi:MAG: AraC family transcriptional regulator [Limnohabitans sp.]|nr:AraC family transcriptional regulator [Limnohabitans sp.]
MKSQINELPNDFFNDQLKEVNFYFYKSGISSTNNKIAFNQNLICFLQEGLKEIRKPNSNLILQNDSIFLLKSGNTLMSEKTTIENTYKSILMFFSDEFAFNFLTKNKITFPSKDFIEIDIISIKKDNYISNFEISLDLLSSNSNQKLLENKVEEILLYLFEKCSEIIVPFFQTLLKKNNDIPFLNVIQKEENSNLTIEELAFLCNMSISTFKRKFSEVFQTSPKQYFIEQKMQKAIVLLQQNKRPSEIYTDLGYETLSAFSNEFKKHFGTSPTNYQF